MTVLDTSSGATHRAVTLGFTPIDGDGPTCTLIGYPNVDTGPGGPPLRARRTLRGYLGGLPPGSDAVLAGYVTPGLSPARAVVEWSAVDASGNECPTYESLAVTPPDVTSPVSVAISLDACALEVHPVVDASEYPETGRR